MWSWGHEWWMMGAWGGLVAGGIAWLIWIAIRTRNPIEHTVTPLEELRRRLAAGEVTEHEYRRLLSVLSKGDYSNMAARDG